MTRYRVGSGVDAHRLVPGRALVLGGICIEHDRGLEGHSDGDCVLHALCDGLLGAAAAGDLGEHFPSSDPRWRGAPSSLFLKQTLRLVTSRGFVIENVDLTVITQEPALAPHLLPMREWLAEALEVALDQVSVKAKSTDGLGALGRGEGVAAQAVVLLRTMQEGADGPSA